jgi:hypothetical protein
MSGSAGPRQTQPPATDVLGDDLGLSGDERESAGRAMARTASVTVTCPYRSNSVVL